MRRPVRWTAVAVGIALVCGGCAGEPELEAERARTLQESVLAVTQAAAESRWADALGLLAQSRAALDEGADAGEVSTARYREIDTALDGVEADLVAAQAAAQLAAEQAAAEQAAAEQAAAEQAAAEQAAAEAAAAQAAADKAAAEQKGGPADKGPKGKDEPPAKK